MALICTSCVEEVDEVDWHDQLCTACLEVSGDSAADYCCGVIFEEGEDTCKRCGEPSGPLRPCRLKPCTSVSGLLRRGLVAVQLAVPENAGNIDRLASARHGLDGQDTFLDN